MNQDAARRVSLAEARVARVGLSEVAGAYEHARCVLSWPRPSGPGGKSSAGRSASSPSGRG
jgi:hypothetical protein